MLTNEIFEPRYSNNDTTAIGVAIPYTVSTNVAGSVHDSVLVTTGGYSFTLGIQNRSNVPDSIFVAQTSNPFSIVPGKSSQNKPVIEGYLSDSSVVASNYSNLIHFIITVKDIYGNPVTDPGTSVTIAPIQNSYKLNLLTNGHTKFVGTDTVAADTVIPSSGTVLVNLYSGKSSGYDTLIVNTAKADSITSITKSAPIWVTPAAFAALSITPDTLKGVVAGQAQTFTVEKQDVYGNHIDFGLAGANRRGFFGAYTAPTSAQITADSGLVIVDTVLSGHNRGGYVTHTYTISGKAGVASVGGNLDMTVPFTAYTAGADTQKIYASLSGKNDTSIVYSIATGALRSFSVVIAAADSVHNAGDSVLVKVTPLDSLGHTIFAYNSKGQSFTVNHLAYRLSPTIAKDSTFYFTYVNSNGKYVKSIGSIIPDTVLQANGVEQIYLHKFIVDSVNTVSISASGIKITTLQGVRFKPLDPTIPDANNNYHWLVVVGDSLKSTGGFSVTVTPRDQYYNVNSTQQCIINVSSNQLSGFNVGSNPRVITGTTTFDGTLTGAKGQLIVYVFSSDNNNLYGQSAALNITITAVEQPGIQYQKYMLLIRTILIHSTRLL